MYENNKASRRIYSLFRCSFYTRGSFRRRLCKSRSISSPSGAIFAIQSESPRSVIFEGVRLKLLIRHECPRNSAPNFVPVFIPATSEPLKCIRSTSLITGCVSRVRVSLRKITLRHRLWSILLKYEFSMLMCAGRSAVCTCSYRNFYSPTRIMTSPGGAISDGIVE